MKTTRSGGTPIRVALIDDHTLFRQSLKSILHDEPGLAVVGDAAGRVDGLDMLRKTAPDILLQDIGLGSDDGLAMIPEIKAAHRSLKCLVLTGLMEGDIMLKAIRNQADGFIQKDCSIPDLVKAIRKMADGHTLWDPILLTRIADKEYKAQRQESMYGMAALSPVERKIAHLIAEGLTNREIGKHFHLADKTIRNRLTLILNKLQVKRRSQIATLYTRSLASSR